MRLLFIDKTAVLAGSHERYEKIASKPGIDLCVLSPTEWSEHMREVPAERITHPDYEIRLGETFWTGSYSRGFYRTGLAKALTEFRPDIIQLLEEPWSLFAGQAVWLARKRLPSAKILFYTWENIFRAGTYCSNLDFLHRRIEKRVFAESTSGICATHLAAEVLKRRGFKGPTPVIPYGIHEPFLLDRPGIERRALRPISDPPRIGYVGRLLRMKGVDTLIEALPLVSGRLVILGGGEAEEDLKRLAHRLEVADRTDWIPVLPPEEVPRHLEQLDILVLPSRTTPVWAEQLGRVLLEAMAQGVPVIGSSSGSIPEVIGSDGLIFPEGDSAALAEAIHKIQSDAALRERNILAGWNKVRGRYTWDHFAGSLVAHYRELA
jgi:glycosyltransferase involved in cell wall biosynthesis